MTALVILGGIVGVGVLMVVSSVFNGYALSVLWGWFVVPTFGAPALDIVPAIGFAIMVSYLTYQTHDYEVKKGWGLGETVVYIIIILLDIIAKPSIALVFGWVVHLFM